VSFALEESENLPSPSGASPYQRGRVSAAKADVVKVRKARRRMGF
jgi:hypothetical protein